MAPAWAAVNGLLVSCWNFLSSCKQVSIPSSRDFQGFVFLPAWSLWATSDIKMCLSWKMVLLQLSETCLIFTMKTFAASSFPVPNETRPVPSSSHIKFLQFTCSCCLAISPSLFFHILVVSTEQPAALLQSWNFGEAVCSPWKCKPADFLCFQEILQRACGATVISGSPQEDSSCRTEGGECGTAAFEVPKNDWGFL